MSADSSTTESVPAVNLATWADAYIRSDEMTAKSWDEARQTAYLGVPSEAVWKARALLRARDRVIAGLTEVQRARLRWQADRSQPIRGNARTDAALRRLGLIRTIQQVPGGVLGTDLTPLGHEIAAELRRREEAGHGK